jgi:uncharacterized protein (TIGR02646 family)
MKYIIKNEEPIEFINWKKQEESTLKRLEERGSTGSTIYKELKSKIDDAKKEAGVFYYSKEELRDALLHEQGGICCYCNQGIKNDTNTTIEHVEDKDTVPSKTFDYNNLLASCNGNLKEPPPLDIHCNLARGNKPLPLSPLDELSEIQFYFTAKGQIKAHCDKGKQTIDVLNLNSKHLIRNREIAIDTYLFNDKELSDMIDTVKAQSYIQKEFFRHKDAEDNFIPFCTAIENVIKRDILNQND